jgi:hypothetical protein
MLHHFANTKSWRHFAVGGQAALPNCTDFLSAMLFERVPIYGPWKQSTPKTTLVDNSNQLIYSTSDRAVTGSFGGSISFLTPERLGVAFPYEQRRNSIFLNDDRDGALKQSNGNDQMVLILDPQENPLRTHEWTSLQPDPLPRSQKGPRLNRTSGQRNGSDGSDFMVIHWLRPIPRPHNSYHAWSD